MPNSGITDVNIDMINVNEVCSVVVRMLEYGNFIYLFIYL